MDFAHLILRCASVDEPSLDGEIEKRRGIEVVLTGLILLTDPMEVLRMALEILRSCPWPIDGL
jgi:hypothetical protein